MADNQTYTIDKITSNEAITDTIVEANDNLVGELELSFNSTLNRKVCSNPGDKPVIQEIRPPYLRRTPNAIPMIIDMVDSNKKAVSIKFNDETGITALKLSPNPDSLTINSSKIINRYNTMTRWVEEHWGDEIDTITFSGSSYSFSAQSVEGNKIGLAVINRNYSEAYKFIKALINIYRTNGYLYQENNDYLSKSFSNLSSNNSTDYMIRNFLNLNPNFVNNHPRQGMIKERLYIRIQFDYVSFFGFFESFDITEDSSSPFKFVYNVIFKSEKTVWMLDK